MKTITILIVDDHTLIRDTWASLLPMCNPNFSVTGSVGDGHKAIELAETKAPDIILMDINMSPMDGYETLKAVLKVAPTTRVIAVSMNVLIVCVKKMMRLGASGYVTKNSPVRELINAIETVAAGEKYLCTEIKNALAEEEICDDENNPAGKINLLTKRELDIIQLVCQGLSSKDIASCQHISLKTVEIHRYNVLKKLKVKNTASLVDLMNTCGLVEN